jgi:hypothetical protein
VTAALYVLGLLLLAATVLSAIVAPALASALTL